jgi:hypothetical protein
MNQRLKLYTFDNYYEWLWCENWNQGRYWNHALETASSVTYIMSDLNWAPLEVRRIRYSLIFFYKVIHHLVAIPYSNLLIPVDTRTRHSGFQMVLQYSNFGRTKALNACSLMAGECTFKFLLINPSDWLALAVMVLIYLSNTALSVYLPTTASYTNK